MLQDLINVTKNNLRRFTFAISNGMVYAFGLNNTGQLGVGTLKNSGAPTAVKNISNVKAVYGGYEHSFFLIDDIGDVSFDTVPNFL